MVLPSKYTTPHYYLSRNLQKIKPMCFKAMATLIFFIGIEYDHSYLP